MQTLSQAEPNHFGTHEQLPAARGFYNDLYASQFEEVLDPAS